MKHKKHPFNKSVGYALSGLRYFFLHERNGQIQLAAAVVVIIASCLFHISTGEWMIVLLCVGAVLSLEMLNCAIEKLCDLVHEDYHPIIKVIKDVAAASVLFASLISIAIACFIFIPKIV